MTSETVEPSAADRALRAAPFVVLGAPDPSAAQAPGTIALHVESLLKAPPSLAGLEGQTILVQPDESRPEPTGPVIVLAEGVSYGQTVTVREIGRLPADAAEAVRPALEEGARRAWVDALRDRTRGASVIVVGRVEELTRHPARREAQPHPASEHDPDWWMAMLLVRDVIVGRPRMTKQRIQVAFPNSDDVMWAHVPKPRQGLEAIFVLRREKVRELTTTVYTARDPRDVRPLEERELVAELAKERP